MRSGLPLVALGLAGCPTALDPVLELEGDATAGEVTWISECALCHGADGTGSSRGSALVGIFDRRTDAEVLDVLRLGTGTMPPYEERLSDQDLADLLAWMRGAL